MIGDPDLKVSKLYGMLPASGDVIIAGSVTDEEAKGIYLEGWKAPRPYLRIRVRLRHLEKMHFFT